MTGKKIGCVQHDCDDCMAFNKALADTIAEAEDQVQAELLSGNTVKEAWWKGKLAGLRAAQAMRSNTKFN